jgi:hypothetical protein
MFRQGVLFSMGLQAVKVWQTAMREMARAKRHFRKDCLEDKTNDCVLETKQMLHSVKLYGNGPEEAQLQPGQCYFNHNNG